MVGISATCSPDKEFFMMRRLLAVLLPLALLAATACSDQRKTANTQPTVDAKDRSGTPAGSLKVNAPQ
jgi:hypothetical protein